jgi:hypothetical protein
MSKIKEELLNNLSEEEMEQRYGLSAFEYVELMDKYKTEIENNEITEDVVYQQWLEQEKLNEHYWETKAEETMDRINAYYDTRYCAADVEGALSEVTSDERIVQAVMKYLNEIYLKRTVYELQQIQMVDERKEA